MKIYVQGSSRYAGRWSERPLPFPYDDRHAHHQPRREMIRILYFGVLRDRVGRDSEELAWNGGSTDALLQHLRDRGPQWAEALAPGQVFRMAVNRQMAYGEVPVPDGAEVGILPPVTGG